MRSTFTVRFSGCGKSRKTKPQPNKEFPVIMARGNHLYPSRTQKLSLLALMVLGWKRPGRVGRRRIPKGTEVQNLRFPIFREFTGACVPLTYKIPSKRAIAPWNLYRRIAIAIPDFRKTPDESPVHIYVFHRNRKKSGFT